MGSAVCDKTFAVPDRGVRGRCVGFSKWLEYVMAGGLCLLFFVGMHVESYHQDVFRCQVESVCLAVLAAAAFTMVALDDARTRIKRVLRVLLFGCAAVGLAYAALRPVPQSLTLVGLPSVGLRLVVYVSLAALGFWAWGSWLWLYAVVVAGRALPDPGTRASARQERAGRKALRRFRELLGGLWRGSWQQRLSWALSLPGAVIEGHIARDVSLAVLDPLFLFPSGRRWDRQCRYMSAVGHRLIDRDHPVAGEEFDLRRFSSLKTLVVILSAALFLVCMVQVPGCRHETPKGILGGLGNRIARGRVPVQRQRAVAQQKKVQQVTPKTQEKIVRESALKLFRKEMALSDTELEVSASAVAEDVGLPDGQGQGNTAAGSPKGTKIGGKYYFYRLKYSGGNWDANRKGIPALMQEFTKAVNVKTNPNDQAVTLSDLPNHKDEYFPVLLYITGNGGIDLSKEEVDNLRNYLMAGGFLFADSSGGDFYGNFMALMKRVLPDNRFRTIPYDHTVFRGDYMPWQMREGCPVYRQHQGAGPAQGLFLQNRLAVFYSGGDLGAAWASVGWARNTQRNVQDAFRMGINVICYSMLYGGSKGLEDKE